MGVRMLDRYVMICLGLDSLLILAALAVAESLRLILPFGVQLGDSSYVNPGVYGLSLLCWLVSSFHFRLYEWRWTVTLRREAGRILASCASFTLLFAAGLYLSFREVPRLLFIYYAPLAFLVIMANHLIVRQVAASLPWRGTVRIAIVGTGRIAGVLASRIARRSRSWPPTVVVGFIASPIAPEADAGPLPFPILGAVGAIEPLIEAHGITTVLLALPPEEHPLALRLSKTLSQSAVDVRLLPDVLDLASAQATIEYVEGLPLLGLRDPALTLPSRIVKYTFDRVVSAVGLVVIAPLLLLIALAIKLDSPGPLIYRARRIGEGGRDFDMLKFRTMRPDAEHDLLATIGPEAARRGIFKVRDDPRVTRVGRILRRTSLDELPQLVNVLRGEMSIVGPRPEQPFIAERYESWQRKRTGIRPGLTGWWQVNGRSNKPLHQNTDFDLYYLENYSFWLDLRIIGRTVSAVVRGDGAY
jgi:exopolysaccharide biosynthesis polyprenyl glycosylphosphotransferase